MSQEPLFTSQIEVVPTAPVSHLYYNVEQPDTYPKSFKKSWKGDLKILRESLPSGIHLKFFEDRMDLISAMIIGPTDTPYEGCLFFFDVMLPSEYPKKQPRAKYIKFHESNSPIHPNIFQDGSICLSLLNQATKRAQRYSIFWMPGKSTLLQLFVSLQGLVLAKDPLNNISLRQERTSDQSKTFNHNVLTNVIQSMIKQIETPLAIFREETLDHYRATGMTTHAKIRKYSSGYVASFLNLVKRVKVEEPPFPLLTPIPADLVQNFYDTLQKLETE